MGKRHSFLLNRKVCQAAGIVAVLASISATATIIAGFINMATFHAISLEPSVGIWCGILLFLHVVLGLAVMTTRHSLASIVYMVVNLVSLALCIYGVIICIDYWDDFKTFRRYNDGGKCTNNAVQCICSNSVTNATIDFKLGYTVSKCSLFGFGEDLWLILIVLVVSGLIWSLLGLVIGLGAIFTAVVEKEKARQKNANKGIPHSRIM